MWIGIVPENGSTGGKVKQKGSPRRAIAICAHYLLPARWPLWAKRRRPDKHPWVAKLLGRVSAKQAAIAIANKTARIAWAIMVHGGVYEAVFAPQYRRRRARLPAKRPGEGLIAAATANDCNARARE